MEQIRILVTEDDKQWQRAIERALNKLPFPCKVVLVSNYDDADSRLTEEKFDIITLDMMLTELEEKDKSTSSGWLLVENLKRGDYPRAGEIGIIILSGSTDFQDQPNRVAELIKKYNVENFLWKQDRNWHEKLRETVENIYRKKQENARIASVELVDHALETYAYNLATIRSLLIVAFSSEELQTLCFDDPLFRPAFERFTRDMGKDRMIQELIEYCDRQLIVDKLLITIKKRNPGQFAKFEPKL
jgi:CheY-like chemotaxis protein